jgi:hypothetical protein
MDSNTQSKSQPAVYVPLHWRSVSPKSISMSPKSISIANYIINDCGVVYVFLFFIFLKSKV